MPHPWFGFQGFQSVFDDELKEFVGCAQENTLALRFSPIVFSVMVSLLDVRQSGWFITPELNGFWHFKLFSKTGFTDLRTY